MNSEAKNIVMLLLVSLIIFLSPSVCFSKTEISDEILSINSPDELIFNYNFSDNNYLFSLDIKNLKNKNIENITLTLDSNDFVDNIFSIRTGSLSPNENKSVKVTSIFNNFIEDWKGNGELNINVTVNYYYLNSYHNVSFEIPIIYGESKGSNQFNSNSNNISVAVDSNKSIDDLFSTKKPVNKYNSPSEISISRSLIDENIILDEVLRKKILNTIIKKPDFVSLYGRVLSIKGTPLSDVKISHKFIDEKTTSDSEGYYTLSLFKGDLDIIYEYDGYWPQEIKLNIAEKKSYNLKTVHLIPRLSTPTMLAFDADDRPWHLPNKKERRIGNLLDVVVGFKSNNSLPSINSSDPYFVYIPSATSEHNKSNVELYRIYNPNILHIKNVIKNDNIRVSDLYTSSERIDAIYEPLNNGKAYKIKPYAPLNDGKFAFSNILQVRNPLFLSIINEPLIYPFKTNAFNAPKFFSLNRNPTGIVADYEILDKWIDSETILANITISNVGGGWYLVDLLYEPFMGKEFSGNMTPVVLNKNLELPLLMEPVNQIDKIRQVKINNIKFRKNQFIRIHAYRDDMIIAYIVTLDMIYRALFGKRLELNDLEIFEKLIDITTLKSQKIVDIKNKLFEAVKNKNYVNICIFMNEFKKSFYNDSIKGTLKSNTFKNMYGTVTQKNLLDVFEMTNTAIEIIKLPNRLILMRELISGEHRTKIDSDSIVYTK